MKNQNESTKSVMKRSRCQTIRLSYNKKKWFCNILSILWLCDNQTNQEKSRRERGEIGNKHTKTRWNEDFEPDCTPPAQALEKTLSISLCPETKKNFKNIIKIWGERILEGTKTFLKFLFDKFNHDIFISWVIRILCNTVLLSYCVILENLDNTE